jgi:serine/threonine protein phosphatase PrpC
MHFSWRTPRSYSCERIFRRRERRVPKSGDAARMSASATSLVRAAIAAANNRIFHLAGSDAARKGMACVLTLAIVEDGQITVGHVGDSRL